MSDRPNLLLLYPGPLHSVEEYFGARLEWLSESFEGVVVTLSEEVGTRRIGRFEVKTGVVDPPGFPQTLGRLARLALRTIREQRRAGRRFDLVATYDHLKTGLLGWLLHRRPEVYGYIAESLAAFPDRKRLEARIGDAGFERVSTRTFYLGTMAIVTFRKPPA